MIYVNTLSSEVNVTTNSDGTVVLTQSNPSPSNVAIQFQDEGLNLGTKGTADVVNFVGSGVTVTRSGDTILVTVSGGGGGSGATQSEVNTGTATGVYVSPTTLQKLDNDVIALVDGATIDITGPKHTLTTSTGRIFTISHAGEKIIIYITLNATSATFTFPITAFCIANGTASGANTLPLIGASGDTHAIEIQKIGSTYVVIGKNVTRPVGIDDIDILSLQAMGSSIKGQSLMGRLGEINASGSLVDQRLYGIAIYLPKPATLTGIKLWQRTTGSYTADNNNRAGLYTESSGTVTLAASCANTGTLWSTASNQILTIPFSSTYAARAGLFYVGFLYNNSAQTTAPTLCTGLNPATNQLLGDFANNNRFAWALSTQIDLASPITLSSTSIATALPFWAAVY